MKNVILLACFFICANNFINAQITISSVIIPSVGDTLTTSTDATVGTISLGDIAGPQVWDFTSLDATASTEMMYKDASEGAFSVLGADLLVTNGDLETYYNKTNNKLELIGTFGPDALGLGINALATYDPAQVVYDTPMAYGDENMNIAQQLFPSFGADVIPGAILDSLNFPITPDSLRFSLQINEESVVDAYGTLSIPLGDFEVLRERRTSTRTVFLGVKIGPFPWVDVEIPNNTFDIPATTAYYFWSNNAKEPIAVANVTGEDEQIVSIEYKAGGQIISSVSNLDKEVINVSVQPNPAKNQARFMFNNLPDGNYNLIIFDLLGRQHISTKIFAQNNSSLLIDISSLQSGTYFYSLSNDKGEIVSTKELVVQ